jgi:hypothetical protein
MDPATGVETGVATLTICNPCGYSNILPKWVRIAQTPKKKQALF